MLPKLSNMKIRAALRLGLFALVAWLGTAAVALADDSVVAPYRADFGFDYIPGPQSDQGGGLVVSGTSQAYGVHGDYQLPVGPIPVNAGFDYRNWQSTIAGTATAYGTNNFDFRAGAGLPFFKDVFIGVGYLQRNSPLGSMGGPGFGIDKLPRYEQTVAVYGSVWFYPAESGSFVANAFLPAGVAPGSALAARVLKYRFGVVVGLGTTPIFIDAGVAGDTGKQGNSISNNFSEGGFFLGLRAALK